MNNDRQRFIGIAIIVGIIVFAFGSGSLSFNIVRSVLLIVPAIIFHEVAHGFVANLRGDDTAKRAGRLTLNPVKHIDLVGTIILPAMLVFSGLPPFGYAKPVPVNISKLRKPRTDAFLVGIAGPFSNLLLAFLATFFINYAYSARWSATIVIYAIRFGIFNIFLAVFNLLPIPPLDGSSIYELFLPVSKREAYHRFRQYAMIGLFVMLLVFSDQLQSILHTMQAPFRYGYCQSINKVLPADVCRAL